MKKTVEMDIYICDNCGVQLEDGNGCTSYVDYDIFDVYGYDSNWIELEDKHYCPDCYEIDEEDNVVIKKI